MQSLAAIRARIERLWSDEPSDPETLIIHLREPDVAQCPSCETDSAGLREADGERRSPRRAGGEPDTAGVPVVRRLDRVPELRRGPVRRRLTGRDRVEKIFQSVRSWSCRHTSATNCAVRHDLAHRIDFLGLKPCFQEDPYAARRTTTRCWPAPGKEKRRHVEQGSDARSRPSARVRAHARDGRRADRNATGLAHFFLRDEESGQFERITNPDQIERALNAPNAREGSTYWIYETNPNVAAFTDLLNRTLDKPQEPEQTLNLGISEQTLQILDRWKLRNLERELATEDEDEQKPN